VYLGWGILMNSTDLATAAAVAETCAGARVFNVDAGFNMRRPRIERGTFTSRSLARACPETHVRCAAAAPRR
jgi:hypothetical protein